MYPVQVLFIRIGHAYRRIIERFFAAHAVKMVSLQQGGARWEGDLPRVRLVTRHALMATDEEMGLNPRARSAKLRTAERM